MKRILQNIIIYFIQIIEHYEYREIDTSGESPLQKILDILFIDKRVESDYGKVGVTEIVKTIPLERYELELENGIKIECADSHIVYCEDHTPKLVIDLRIEDYVITKEGLSRVKRVRKLGGKLSMYDLTIEGPEPSYYTNGILSHNTVSAALVILHYVLFNNDKSVMIVANKGKTVIEIISKIKGVYKLLPFFLQSGIITWNEKSLTFENGCRIQTENRTKEPSIGFTIDFLYLDEFAKVPDNIVESYYGAIVPTVSSVNNSKIIITSTPDGYNLFHKLLIGAEKSPEDPDKNMYEAMRVYWYQVAGRRDVRIFPLSYKLKEYSIDRDDIYNYLDKRYSIYEQEFNNRENILVKWDFDDERTYIHNIRGQRMRIDGRDVPLAELCIITNWQEEETKLIGGSDMFNQEYDLKFITGDKMLFSSEQMEKFKKDSVEFKYIKIPELDSRLLLPYTNLKWLSGRPDIFDIRKAKDYYMVAAIDLGEGLAQDYSIINIFRLMPKSKELIEKSHETLNTLYDYFYIEQVGLFRSNDWSVDEVAEIFYVLFFEIFDSEKSKAVLEYNTYGGKFLSELIHVFDDQNDYSNGIFLRYKHKKEDKMVKVGMKVTGGDNEASKKLLVKQLQTAVRKQLIKINNSTNVNEITTFTKKVTPSGNFTYSASVGHDDIVMTNVDVSSVFSHVQYKNMVDDLYNQLSIEERNVIDKYLSGKRDEKVDYSGSMDARNRVYGNKGNSNPFTPQLGKSTRFRPNIPSRNTNPWNR